jgi:mannose-6-phosphate isomerase-like protein (cupin superfamily)
MLLPKVVRSQSTKERSMNSLAVPVKGDGFEIADYGLIKPEMCPCGPSRRAFVDRDGTESLHFVRIQKQDKPHRHKTREIYFILECGPNAAMIINGKRYPVTKNMPIKIGSNVWHCADRGGDEEMAVLVYVQTGHDSPEAKMELQDQGPTAVQ